MTVVLLSCLIGLIATADLCTACEGETPCTDIYEPVCGTNGVTYGNECELTNAALCDADLAGLTTFKNCECDADCTSAGCVETPCLDIYDPVCGSDGETYGNECELNNAASCRVAHLSKFKDCACDEDCTVPGCVETPCLDIYDPVCGSDGEMYGNECELNNAAACRVAHLSKFKDCACDEDCTVPGCVDAPCPEIYDPVCGSNGVTYGNQCELTNAASCHVAALSMFKDCACDEGCVAPGCVDEGCSRNYDPVCGSNGVTYSNECVFNNEARCHVAAVSKVKDCACEVDGPCDDLDCDFACTKIYQPVCASNGETYGNECEMDRANCLRGGADAFFKVKDCACDDDSADCGGAANALAGSGVPARKVTAAVVSSLFAVAALSGALLFAMWKKQMYCFGHKVADNQTEEVTLVDPEQARSDENA